MEQTLMSIVIHTKLLIKALKILKQSHSLNNKFGSVKVFKSI